MKFNANDLTIEELTCGYVFDSSKQIYSCIFCEKKFEEGYIYEKRGDLLTAKKAIEEHIKTEHSGVFLSLISLEKEINGISNIQKEILKKMFEKKENKEIADELEIAPSTVRTHKFYLQKMKRQAKIFIAILEALNKENILDTNDVNIIEENEIEIDSIMSVNSLHPFFTQYDLK